MANYSKKQLVHLIKETLATDLEEVMKQLTDKYEEFSKDKVDTEISMANKELTRNYPETGNLTLVLKEGSLTLPYQEGTKIKFLYDRKDIVEYTVDEILDVDIFDIYKTLDKYEYVEIFTSTPSEVTVYDEEAFEKDGSVVSVIRNYQRDFYCLCKTADVSAIYRTIGKFEN